MKEQVYQFKFGDKVRISDPFFGDLEGVVLSVQIIKKGIWPFKKKHIFYQVDTLIEDACGDEVECMLAIEEKYLAHIKEFMPTIIK